MNKLNTETILADQWYDIKAIANAFCVSTNTVRSWQQRKQMPAPDIQQHRFTRWKAETIEPFISDPIGWRENNKSHGEV